MSEPTRRRFRRFRVRLTVRFLRGDADVAGEIFNISRSGCLLVTSVALKPGERLEAHLPGLGRPPAAFRVVRSRPIGPWHAVAADFEPHLPDEARLEELTQRGPPSDVEPDQLF